MDKIIKIIFGVFIIFSLNACQIQNQKKEIDKYIESISLKDFQEKKSKKETFIIYLGFYDSPECNLLNEQIINDIDNNKSLKKLVYLDISQLNQKEWDYFKEKHNIMGIPSFIYVEKGIEKSSYSWSKKKGFNYKDFVEWINNKILFYDWIGKYTFFRKK